MSMNEEEAAKFYSIPHIPSRQTSSFRASNN